MLEIVETIYIPGHEIEFYLMVRLKILFWEM